MRSWGWGVVWEVDKRLCPTPTSPSRETKKIKRKLKPELRSTPAIKFITCALGAPLFTEVNLLKLFTHSRWTQIHLVNTSPFPSIKVRTIFASFTCACISVLYLLNHWIVTVCFRAFAVWNHKSRTIRIVLTLMFMFLDRLWLAWPESGSVLHGLKEVPRQC